MPRTPLFIRRVAAGCAAGALAAASAALIAPRALSQEDPSVASRPAGTVLVPAPESVVQHLIWERTHCRGCETVLPGKPAARRERAP